MAKEDCLKERTRAEDIILGSLGFDEDASIVEIRRSDSGFVGVGRWNDGQTFEFSSEDQLSTLEEWALRVLSAEKKAA